MANYSPDVEADIRQRSVWLGATLGLLALPFSFLTSALGGAFELGSFAGVLPVLGSGGWAGFLAAMFLDWRKVRPEDSLGVGIKVGSRTALVASSIAAVVTLVLSLFTSEATLATVGAMGWTNALILLFGILPGVLCGVLGGILGAAIKRPSGTSVPDR